MDAPFPSGMLKCIEVFLQEDSHRPVGCDIYDEVFETSLFFPLQRKRELVRMMQLARHLNPVTVMEIGSDKGGGLYHWCKCLPTVRNVIAAEIRGTPYSSLFEQTFPDKNFLWLESSYAQESIQQVWEWMYTQSPDLSNSIAGIDCLFIDGDKLEFLTDFDVYYPLLRRPAMVFLHDITDREPQRAYQTLLVRGYRHEEIIDRSEGEEAYERAGLPRNAYDAWLKHWAGNSCGVGVIYVD
jgi:hypothetical protein